MPDPPGPQADAAGTPVPEPDAAAAPVTDPDPTTGDDGDFFDSYNPPTER